MTPDEHAAKAIELLAHADNDIMYEVQANTIAQAQVHATLATRPAGPDTVNADEYWHLHTDLEHAKQRYRDYETAIAAITDHLNQYGQTFTGGLDAVVDRIGELMDRAYNGERAEGKPTRPRPVTPPRRLTPNHKETTITSHATIDDISVHLSAAGIPHIKYDGACGELDQIEFSLKDDDTIRESLY